MRSAAGVFLLLFLTPQFCELAGSSVGGQTPQLMTQEQSVFVRSATSRIATELAHDEAKINELDTQIANANNELAAAREQRYWAERKRRIAEMQASHPNPKSSGELREEMIFVVEAEKREARRAEILPQVIMTAEGLAAERRDEVAKQKKQVAQIKQTLDTVGFAETLTRIVFIVARRNILSAVSIVSVDANSKSSPGAIVRYQTTTQRQFGAEPRSAKNPTECKEPMNVDEYYIWTERGNRVTSNKNRKVYIADPEEKVTLIEDQ